MHRFSESIRGFAGWRASALLAISFASFLLFARPALATFHEVSIKEVYPGSIAHPDSGFVELQMYSPEQNFVQNHAVILFDASGTMIASFPFPANLPGIGVDQETMLVGDDGVEATFGVKPDLVSSTFNVPASGAACWDALDCVSWGAFSGTTTPDSGVPADPGGIPDGMALVRRTTGGNCANLLDPADDTNDSSDDFFNAAPTPESYATVPSPPACSPPGTTPATSLDSKPAAITKATTASFDFHSSPAATSFECRLDHGEYKPCDSGTVDYSSLGEGLHTFRVHGLNANGVGAPASYSWTVDLTAPTASITVHPVNPSPGKTASFRYSSSEGGSKFVCQLSPIEVAFTSCDSQPKVYSTLADGEYTFEVKAIDTAGNEQATPTSFPWTVDNSLEDKTPPETTINSHPPDPSGSPVASFTYSSNEPGSTFQCKLDGGSFGGCPATGISYSGLREGPHTFQVRAIDPSNNIDPTPAGYSFQVVLGAAAPIGAPPPALPTRPHLRPNTKIGKASAKTHDRTPTVRFSSDQPGAKFQCRLDHGPFVACRSPFTTKKLSYGSHVFEVRAMLGALIDTTPAKLDFKVVKS